MFLLNSAFKSCNSFISQADVEVTPYCDYQNVHVHVCSDELLTLKNIQGKKRNEKLNHPQVSLNVMIYPQNGLNSPQLSLYSARLPLFLLNAGLSLYAVFCQEEESRKLAQRACSV